MTLDAGLIIAIFAVFIIGLALGVPIAISLGLGAISGLLYNGGIPLAIIGQRIYAANDSFSMLAVPFFMFAGAVMTKGGISKRLVDMADCIVGRFTGGLAMCGTLAAMLFAALSGSSTATTAAIGGCMIETMREKGYDDDFSAASIAAAGTTGIVIPPSIPMVVYALATGTSIGAMFMGGVIPGILLGAAMMITNYIISKKRGYKGSNRVSSSEVIARFKDGIWGLLMPIIILGGIYSGVFSPTESAAVACVYGLIVSLFVYREIKVKDIYGLIVDAIKSTALVMLIMSTAGLFSWVMTAANVPQQIAGIISSLTTSRFLVMLLVNIFLLILGCLINASAAISIVAPILIHLW